MDRRDTLGFKLNLCESVCVFLVYVKLCFQFS